MAEIKDVYSLEFNSGQFQAEINAAIGKIEELNAAMEEGADVSSELADAQSNLVGLLGTEAKGIENLNAKRNVLVNTQKSLNKETKTGVAVGKQLDATNKQIAISTGNTIKSQKSFGATLLQGTRAISQMRRVASTLTFAFRAITAAIPFGFILALAGPVISFITSFWQGVDKSAENMEKLNDSSLTYTERLSIIQTELDRLNSIEERRGKLTDEEKKMRDDLKQKYKETADEIVKIEEDRAKRQADLLNQLAEVQVRLLGDTVAGANASFELQRRNALKGIQEQFKAIKESDTQLFKDLAAAEAEFTRTSSNESNKRVLALRKSLEENAKDTQALVQFQNAQLLELELQRNEKIRRINEQAQQKKDEFNKRLLQEEIDGINQQQEIINAGIEEFLAEQNKLYEDALEARRQAEEAYKNEVSLKLHDEELALLASQLKIASDYRQTNRETQLANDLILLEQERNQKLAAAVGDVKEQEKIQKEYDKRRADLERAANQEILKIRIEFLERLRDETAASDPLLTAELSKQIAELKLQFEQLGQAVADGADPKKTGEQYKELIDQTTQVVQLAADTVFNVLNAQLTGYIQNLDQAVDRSRSALDDIRQNSENFNARQLELEKERLEKLENERAKAVEREKTLGQIQVAINAAIAISKAAAEGGGFASAFTIAATLASLIAGLAQARAAAGNAFFHGVEYLERGNNPRGRDTIPAMLNEGERVITTDTNNKYWDVLSAVHNNRIPADVLNSFANAYQTGGLRSALGAFGENISLSSELGNKSIFVNVGQNFSGLENRLERIESVLTELPKYMPKTVVNANAKGIFKIVEQRQNRKNFSRNWAK